MALDPMRLIHEFASDSVLQDTGFKAETIQYLWRKYNAWNGSAAGTFDCADLPGVGSLVSRAYHFYCIFVLIHKCPQVKWTSTFRSKDGRHSLGARTVRAVVYPLAGALAAIIDEIDRSKRLSPFNHGPPPFDFRFTGIVDTFPVYCPAPHRFALRRLLFQPKYKACVLKYQLGITFAGEIILFTGPHLGTIGDCTIWEATWRDHPFYPWEVWMADLGYVGCDGLIVKYKGDQVLGAREIWFNNVHEHIRNRCEQMVSVVKSHRMFRPGVYRRGFGLMQHLVKIVGHTTAYEHNTRAGARFRVYGPWQHVY